MSEHLRSRPGSPIKRPLSALLNVTARQIVTGTKPSTPEERQARLQGLFASPKTQDQENVSPRTAKATVFQKSQPRLNEPLPQTPDASPVPKRQTWGPRSADEAAWIAHDFVRHSPAPPSPVPPQSVQPEQYERVFPTQPQYGLSRSANTEESEGEKTNRAFEALLDTLDVTPSVREKMMRLDMATKQGMLLKQAASAASASSKPPSSPTKKKSTPLLKKARSLASLRTKRSQAVETEEQPIPDDFVLVTPVTPTASMVTARPRARSRTNSAASAVGGAAGPIDNTPEAWAMVLRTTNHTNLLPSHLIKLRMLLRNEKPEWVAQWVKCQGYKGLLERLNELVDMEWREEQRDDALLHELLKCAKALTHSEAGSLALASLFPNPFRPLIQLLYTDKKPGDLGPRQIMVELVQFLYEVFPAGTACPPPISSSEWGTPPSYERNDLLIRSPDSGYASHSPQLGAGAGAASTHQLVRSLMLGPPNEKEEALHEFVRGSHTPRPYKRWIGELTSALSDCFWVFCHSSNTIQDFATMNWTKVQAPRVPAGHTGGVEHEFMSYAAAHMKLLNTFIATADKSTAKQLHTELFDSGLERVLAALRKSNKEYYPQIHFELSRYICLAQSARYQIPFRIARHLQSNQPKPEAPATPGRPPRHHARSQTEGMLPPMQF